jgi:tRNA (guanine-N7-)-methyltransferase
MGVPITRTSQLDPGGVGLTMSDLPPAESGPIDVRAWFEADRREAPLELEIGSGKGTFIVRAAERRPGVNFIGVEYARAFWLYAADRCRRRGLGHVRMVYADAGDVVRWYLPDRSIRQMHVYFPDPWPKARHHKRRLIQAPFLEQAHRVLEDPREADAEAGCIRIATDHADYFAWMEEAFAAVADRFERLPFEPYAGEAEPMGVDERADEGELVGTNFERKYRKAGRSFEAAIWRKLPG